MYGAIPTPAATAWCSSRTRFTRATAITGSTPVHETLRADWPETAVRIPGLRIEHWPDAGKSRGSYLPLLELAVREDPDNDRHMHYLGREYYFHREYGRAIETLVRHIHMPSALWAAERAQSMLYIGRCFEALGDDWEAAQWYIRAVGEDTERREARFALARLKYPHAGLARLPRLGQTDARGA